MRFKLISPMTFVVIGLIILAYVRKYNYQFIDIIFIGVSIILTLIVLIRALKKGLIIAWGGWDIKKGEEKSFWITFVGYTLFLMLLIYLLIIILLNIFFGII